MADPTEFPPDDPVATAIAALGTPLATHRVAGRRMHAKMAVGFGLILLGIVANALWWTVGPANFGHVWHLLYMPLAFGVGLIAQVLWNRGVTVYAYPVGILRVGRGKVETFLWDEVKSIKVRSESGKAYGTRGEGGGWSAVWFAGKIPSVRLWTTWIELKRHDGETLKLTPIIDDYQSLATRVQSETFARMWPAVLDKLAAGEPVAFGPWTASATGVTMAKSQVAWADVKKVELTGRFVMIGRKSFWRVGKAGDLSTIENPHVLFALLDERVGDVITVETPVEPKPGAKVKVGDS